MAGYVLSLQVLDELLDELRAADCGTVSDDPHDLAALPGVLVQLAAFEHDTYAGTTVEARLTLIVDDQDHRRARAQLVELYNKVSSVVPALGRVVTRVVQLPDNPAPLPALVVTATVTT